MLAVRYNDLVTPLGKESYKIRKSINVTATLHYIHSHLINVNQYSHTYSNHSNNANMALPLVVLFKYALPHKSFVEMDDLIHLFTRLHTYIHTYCTSWLTNQNMKLAQVTSSLPVVSSYFSCSTNNNTQMSLIAQKATPLPLPSATKPPGSIWSLRKTDYVRQF